MKEVFEQVFNTYLNEKRNSFGGNSLFVYLTNNCIRSFQDTGVVKEKEYKIDFSLGKGNWAVVPWIAVFDRDISTSAAKGYDIVYLFSADMKKVYLSLNQGWTYFKTKYNGKKNGSEKIRQVVEMWQETLKSSLKDFSYELVDLEYNGKATDLPYGYEQGHICGKCYYADNLPSEEEMRSDLQKMIAVFRELKGNIINGSFEDTNNKLLSDYNPHKEQPDISRNGLTINDIIANEGIDTSLNLSDILPDVIELETPKKKSGNAIEIGGEKDYQGKSKKQEKLGQAGEYMVLEYEKKKLKWLNINKKVEHVSVTTHDQAGYDIKSYDETGNEIHIEVKTTEAGLNHPFYLTAAEAQYSEDNSDKYRLYRVYNFNAANRQGDLSIISGNLKEQMNLIPDIYKVKGRKKE